MEARRGRKDSDQVTTSEVTAKLVHQYAVLNGHRMEAQKLADSLAGACSEHIANALVNAIIGDMKSVQAQIYELAESQ